MYGETYGDAGCGCLATAPFPNPIRAQEELARDDPKDRNAAAQRRAALTVLAGRPADLSPWMRLAYADTLAHGGRLSPAGREALDTSYAISPYAGALAPWRAGFALRNWQTLPVPTRQGAAREFEIIVNDPQRLYRLRVQNQHLRGGEGRVAAYFFELL